MKISYRYKILTYFLLVLVATSLLFSLILIRRESQFKLEKLSYRIHPYPDIIYASVKDCTNREQVEAALDSSGDLFPQEMRITIMDSNAWVIFDNFSNRDSILDNHFNRPELLEAVKFGSGSSLRYSNTLKSEYLYFAKKYPHKFVRVALDYNSLILPVIKNDKTWQLYIIIVFLLASAVLVFLTRQISKPYSALKEFIARVEHGEEDYDEIRFPKDEMGGVGEKIMNAFRQLENTKRYKQELTHNVSHELKTPVTGIRGYLETLLQQENLNEEQSRFFIERAYAQSLRLSAIVNDISILNKIEEAADKFEYESINIYRCLKEIEGDLSFKLEEKKIRFNTDVSQDLEIEGNYLLIYSLFKNLIDNSIEHAGEDLDIYVKVTGVTEREAYFSYYDTGKGVPEEHIHRIFERFYRVEKGRSRKSGGSGLGLAIVRNAVHLHKGKIVVCNRADTGLQFDFTLAMKL
ncbi:MAG: histidine kinase [Bacteroidetes bacterium HGW-Bacteroidetes-8]|jgi:signal transduction histidine kinase|nr:MAG: histidine kinase [Bacteroidetes bacterium HGW-Bacteroidetes-8]